MWKLTAKNVMANKIRFALTALAIVLGVGFITAANVMSDGLRSSFASLSSEIVQGTDLQVRAADSPGAQAELTPQTESAIAAIDGVRFAEGGVTADDNTVLPIKSDGSTIALSGPPQLMFAWGTDSQLNPASLEAGRAPTGPGEWIIDFDSAAKHDFVVGETYDLIVPGGEGRVSAELVGTLRFGQDNITNGAVIMAMERTTSQTLFGTPGLFDDIAIATDGSRSIADVQADIQTALGSSFEVLDTAELNAEQTAEFNAFISIFAWVLRAFAIVALFVSIFIIANTFKIVMTQRVRELGLLRAVGATPKQVRRAVLGEALVVGVVASVLGLFVGVGLTYVLEAVLGAIGAELPPFSKALSVPTALIALVVGVGVTGVSAWFPARTASRVAPVVAISGVDPSEGADDRRLKIIGLVVTAVGAVLTSAALFGGIDDLAAMFALLGAGAATIFVGVTLVSPAVAGPLSLFLGAPLRRVFKTPGRLAGDNAARNPRRTATTAASLMIGLSLVSMAFVIGQSFKADLNKLLETTVQADYAVFPTADTPIAKAVETEMAARPELTNVAGVRNVDVDIAMATGGGARETEIGALDVSKIDALLNLGLTEGSFVGLGEDDVAVNTDVAAALGVGMGDTIAIPNRSGGTDTLTVEALFADGTLFEGMIVTPERFDRTADEPGFDWIMATVADGSTVDDATVSIDALKERFPHLLIQSSAEYRESISAQIDQMLATLVGFLGLAIFIAFIGIVNTLALSVFERNRELGLLRAVGMTRRQMHRMVRWEAAIVSGVGAVLGAVVGITFGVLVVTALPTDIIGTLSVPFLPIAALVVAASAAGLIAGFLPARRAGKQNILEAIAH